MQKKIIIPIILILITIGYSFIQNNETQQQRIHRLSSNVKCIECNGLSIAESSSITSKGLVQEIKTQVKIGKTDSKIFEYISKKYGSNVILTPQDNLAKNILIFATIAIIAMCLTIIFVRKKNENKSQKILENRYWIIIFLFLLTIVFIFTINKNETKSTNEKTKKITSGPLPNSENAFLTAIKENPNNADLYYNYALLLLNKKKYALSLVQLDKTTKIDETRADAKALSGWVVFLAGLPEQAKERLNAAITINPQYPDSYFYLAMINKSIQNNIEAKNYAQKFLDLVGTSNHEFKNSAKELVNSDN